MAADFAPPGPKSSSSLDVEALRKLVRLKLRNRTLPRDIPRVWGGKGANEICSAFSEKIGPEGLVMEGIGDKMASVQFHVDCFHMWDVERQLG